MISAAPLGALTDVETELLVPIAWRRVTTPRSEDEAEGLIANCLAVRAEILRRIRQRQHKFTLKGVKEVVRQYTLCRSVRVATYALALASRDIKTGTVGAPTAVQLAATGAELRVDRPSLADMIVYKAGTGAGTRGISRFTTEDKARQLLVHDVLKAAWRLPDWMFLYNGGDAAALRWLRRELPSAKGVMVTDFYKCFPLLPWAAVVDGLPVHRKVVECLMFDPWKRVKAKGFNHWKKGDPIGPLLFGGTLDGLKGCAGEIGQGRGIPLGSALSSLAAQYALQRILAGLGAMEGIRLGLFADNLFVLLDDEAKEPLVRDSLVKLSMLHFDSNTTAAFLQRTIFRRPADAVTWLGRLVRLKRGELKLDALPGHNLRIQTRIAADIDSANKRSDLQRPVRRLVGYAVRHGLAPSAARAVIESALDVGEIAAGFGKEGLDQLGPSNLL